MLQGLKSIFIISDFKIFLKNALETAKSWCIVSLATIFCWDHLLYADVINFFVTRKCQKTRESGANVNIEQENFHIFWTTWGTSMKFSGKMWLSIKSKKTRLHPFSLENTDLQKAVKMSYKRTLSEISEFLIFDAG